MKRADYLRGRATLLRKVAATIDVRSIRDRILALAEECVQLAKLVEKIAPEKQAGSRSQPPRAKRAPPRAHPL